MRRPEGLRFTVVGRRGPVPRGTRRDVLAPPRLGPPLRDSRMRQRPGGAFHDSHRARRGEPMVRMLHEVTDRGIERGEVRSDAANGYVYEAIPTMTMYRSNMCESECSDQGIEEMATRRRFRCCARPGCDSGCRRPGGGLREPGCRRGLRAA
ncbi:TetR/AcrR family transcriptional regulator C-terminal ligand-binding domain-containing protein [Streptomyces sp. TRM70350]|nr:TetR/AcrR family transcriptional regulator C-terminal ligand-binding domain-containing protein [Streptomyces sp. TRM70350]